MKDSFLNFSGADYIDGATLTIENAQKHVLVAKILKKEKLYGIAVSHLILGAEEYIKGLLLLNLSGVNDFLSDKEKVELFKNHKFKHKNISDLFKSLTNEAVEDFETSFFV